MTKFCVEDILKEKIRERNLGVDILLHGYAKKQLKSLKITYEIDDEDIENLKEIGIDAKKELIDALENYFKKYPEENRIMGIERIKQC